MKNTYKKIFIVSNSYFNIYNFRYQLIEYLISKGHDITLIASKDNYIYNLKKLNVKIHPLEINSSTNIFTNLILIIKIYKILKYSKPNLVITYTIKPNLYFSLISRFLKINYINNFFGLGYLFSSKIYLKTIIESILKFSLKKSKKIYFQNKYDQNYFLERNIIQNKAQTSLIPGSGIDMKKFFYTKLPNQNNLKFLLISRLLWDKGIKEYVSAAKNLKTKYKNINFSIIGSYSTDNPLKIEKKILNKWKEEAFVDIIDEQFDVVPFITNSHCIVLPSYREGTPKTLLEGMAMGRAIITTDVPGCNHLVENNKNGFLCKPKDSTDLENKMEKFINLNYSKMVQMGKISHEIVNKKYTFDKVLNVYKEDIF